MTYKEAKDILRVAAAEVEWNCPLDYTVAFRMAEEAIDKQIPRKPVGKYTDYRCGVCGTRVRSGKGSSSFTKDTVCRKCFTVIDWGEDNGET